MIKGKSPEEIRNTFNIVNDFTPEEESKVQLFTISDRQIREENKWATEEQCVVIYWMCLFEENEDILTTIRMMILILY